jgi:predicted nucleotidyltransferase
MSKSKLKSNDSQSNLQKLNIGLLLLNTKREMEEPGYTAINRISFGRLTVEKRHSYSSDLERALNELRLTSHLLSEVSDKKITSNRTYEPEEIINYYSGNFFDITHQIKDKLLRMIAVISTEPPFEKAYKEPKKVSVEGFLKRHEPLLKEIGIYELLEEWGESSNLPISITLKKRTQHHHLLSRLQLNKEFQDVKMSKIMLGPENYDRLYDYGKKRMQKLGEESFKKFRDDIIAKQSTTTTAIENNLEEISKKLIEYFKIPIKLEELAKIANAYNDFLGSFKIKNETDKSKIIGSVKAMVDGMVNIAKEHFKEEKIVSIYLVGSCARGEFLPKVSDINLIIITNEVTRPIFKTKEFIEAIFISEKDFLSEEYKKIRFICWSDGILLEGKEFSFSEKDFPRPGIFLCLLLNRDFIEKLKTLKEEISLLKNPSVDMLRDYSLKVVKIMMDFDFGVAMSNKPFYTASRKKKISYTKEVFPEQLRPITLEQIYYEGVVKQTDFPILIDTYLESMESKYEKLINIGREATEPGGQDVQ